MCDKTNDADKEVFQGWLCVLDVGHYLRLLEIRQIVP